MSADGADMLRALGGAAPRPGAAGGPAPAGDGGFAALLEQAQRGEVRTGRPVELAPGLAIELSESQRSRLSDAADRAQAAGAQRALVLLDGRLLTLDVAARQVSGEVQLQHGDVVGRIDAFINASAPDPEHESAVRSLMAGLERRGTMPPGLARALGEGAG